jgi:phage-related baseplate assembly protein
MTSPINLSNVPAPQVVETLSYETILSEMLSDLQSRDATFTGLVESDPAYKILEVSAYRELIIRQRINDSAKSIMLAYATGYDLEQLGANFGVVRKTLIEGNPNANPPIDAVLEEDSDLRYRIQTALNSLSTAGPKSSYLYHALSVDGVKDVAVAGPPTVSAGRVRVTVLSAVRDGTTTQELLDAVSLKLSSDEIRPLTDEVVVQGATIVPYNLNITIYTKPEWDADIIKQQATDNILEYCESIRKVGWTVRRTGIYASAFVAGVERVTINTVGDSLTSSSDLSIGNTSASYLTALVINTTLYTTGV